MPHLRPAWWRSGLRSGTTLRTSAYVEWYRFGEESHRAVGPAPSELSTPPWTALQLLIGQRARSTVDTARSEQFPFPPLVVLPEPSRCVQRGDCYRLGPRRDRRGAATSLTSPSVPEN